jgi:DNA-binding PadR family transcriptional regulator
MLKYVLLGSLNYKPMSGYDLKQFTDRSTSNFWHAELSQIYVTLKALEKDGLIKSSTTPQERRPDKRIYTITESGQRALNDWLITPFTELGQYKDTLLLKLFFSSNLEKEAILAQLRIQRGLHQKLIDQYQTETADDIAKTVERAPHLKRDALLWNATRRFGEMTEETYVRWLDETIEMVESQFESKMTSNQSPQSSSQPKNQHHSPKENS